MSCLMSIKSLRRIYSITLVALLLSVMQGAALAKSAGGAAPTAGGRFIVTLQDPPAALYRGEDLFVEGRNGPLRMAATAPPVTGKRRFNIHEPNVRDYLEYLAQRRSDFLAEAAVVLGREVVVTHEYRNATNGLAIMVSAAEADLLTELPMVRSIRRDEVRKIETYAGPSWVGAGEIWSGDATGVGAKGEGVVIGVIDTGINWSHPSFSHLAKDGYVHSNPLGFYLGLCGLQEVQCNDKLIGVYDYVKDDPLTPDVEEENTNGLDNQGHGSHVASIAAGNPASVSTSFGQLEVSGVAPRANIISYRVCFEGVPASEEEGGCQYSATLKAIDQAVEDGVDVINYSVGGGHGDPWSADSEDITFLGARAAGIFIAASAGNTGPSQWSVGSPALAPWITAVGSARHNVIPGNRVRSFTGGTGMVPEAMVGASLTSGSGQRVIVHARDYGNALCGAGEPESGRTCSENTGRSNPWAGEKPFNGEIVVCDRGTYGRVEKGRNLELAGAGGYILANTERFGEWIVADDHCLPASHVGLENGDKLREWLASGSGHGAEIEDSMLIESDSAADQLDQSSSRGPVLSPVEDVLKPNVIAPGVQILAAYKNGSNFTYLSGTSMASPHVAGGAALLKSARPSWSASELSSVIELTATQELAQDENGFPASTQQVGAGRPQLGMAVNAGLYLEVTEDEFRSARPAIGGNPKNLNLPGLVDADCTGECAFTRTVTDLMGGGDWTVLPEGFPRGTVVTITPSGFSLAGGESRVLQVSVNIEEAGELGEWVNGKIRLSAEGSPDLFLTVAVSGGRNKWVLDSDRSEGWQAFELKNLEALPNATFTVGGLVRQERRAEQLVEDPTRSDPYDGVEGVFLSLIHI